MHMMLWLLSFVVCQSKVRNINDIEIENAATWALEELSNLSESGIYKTLHLESIQQASSTMGVFHDTIHMVLKLNSPYFQNKKQDEIVKITVMTHLKTHEKSFSIDHFPIMTQASIEAYWITMVKQHRQERKELFESWENENEEENEEEMTTWESKTMTELRHLSLSGTLSFENQRKVDAILEERYTILQAWEEQNEKHQKKKG